MTVVGDSTTFGALIVEQWTLFLNLLNTCKSGTSEKLNDKSNLSWIIDLGASQHMTVTLESLPNLKEI